MSNQKKNKKTIQEKIPNTSKIVSVGHTPNNYIEAFSKFIADLSGVVSCNERKKGKFRYDWKR